MEREKQPKGLYLLFFTELWERFGFYTLQTVIILYMTQAMKMSDTQAYLLYGTFSSMLYLTPVLGGFLADRFLGYQRAVIIGGALLILGYALTAVPNPKCFFLGLSVIIIANGFFKPNLSCIVGDLYRPNDPRRDGGFTLFYMGINLGALIPPLVTGAIVFYIGWHAVFLLAALGMAIGLITFLSGRKSLKGCGGLPMLSPLHDRGDAVTFYALLSVGVATAIGLMLFLFRFPKETDVVLGVVAFVTVGAVLYFLLKEKRSQRNKLVACLILILISIGFWALYNQTFTSLMLFAERNMSKKFLGITIDAEFTQFFNPFFIILLSPILSRLWIALEKKRANPSTPLKFSYGIVFMALGFFVLGIGGSYFGERGELAPWWLVGSYLMQTIGELLLSPIGLAMITTLAPKHLVGMMMGVWFLTQSAAFAIGGGLATLASVPVQTSAPQSLGIYAHAFILYGSISLCLAVVSFMLIPYLKRLIHGPDKVGTIK